MGDKSNSPEKQDSSKDKPKWRAEPWGACGENWGWIDSDDGNRAVVCVNAMEGVGKPEKVRELIEVVKKHVCGRFSVGYGDDLHRALAALEMVK